MDKPETRSELLEKLAGDRRQIVAALDFFDGKANAKQIRDISNIKRGSSHRNFTTLVKWEVIEEAGSEFAGSGGESTVYRLTDKGRSLIGDGEDEISHTPVTVEELEDLPARVTELEAEVETLRSAYTSMRDTLGTIKEDLEAVKEADSG
jgi:predicted ArsR family transcriptional regulator